LLLGPQLKEAQREVALRRVTYPKLIARRAMTEGQADYHLQVMQAIVTTLEGLAEAETQLPLFGIPTPDARKA
jgi:hypothetical protein